MRKQLLQITLFASLLFAPVLCATCDTADNTGWLDGHTITVNAPSNLTDISGGLLPVSVVVPETAKSGEEVKVKIHYPAIYGIGDYGIYLNYAMADYFWLTKKSDSEYTFRMPGEDVTLIVKFTPKIEKTVMLENGGNRGISLYTYNWLETDPPDTGEWQWQKNGDMPHSTHTGILCYFGHSDEQFKWKSTGVTWNIGDAFGKETLDETKGIDPGDCTEGIQFYCKRAGGANTFRIRLGDGTNWSRYAYFSLKTIPDRWERVVIRWRDQPGAELTNIRFWGSVDRKALRQINFQLVGPEALNDDVTSWSPPAGVGQFYGGSASLLGEYHRVYDFNANDSGYGICGIEAVRFAR